jgi:DNA-binding NarL/FixJ family response regulator
MKILLADDHTLLREGIASLLATQPDLAVVGAAMDGHEAIERARELAPDVVVMDITMPGLNGMDATRRILDARPGTKVIALSMHADRRYVYAMLKAGAAGYLLKNAASDELIHAVRTVAAGGTYVSAGVGSVAAGAFARGEGPPALVDLTTREREIVQLLAEGKTSKEVSVSLSLAVSTDQTHRRQIMSKLGVHSVAELTKYAIRHGLTSAD